MRSLLTGEGLHGKIVRRLIMHMSIENPHMRLSFLLGQIELMLNLIDGFFENVSIKDWCLLAETIKQKEEYLEKIIKNSDKPLITPLSLDDMIRFEKIYNSYVWQLFAVY
jgi:hypothetical protein